MDNERKELSQELIDIVDKLGKTRTRANIVEYLRCNCCNGYIDISVSITWGYLHNSASGLSGPNHRSYWNRGWAHTTCVQQDVYELRCRDWARPLAPKTAAPTRKSAQALLLLQELGLPFDLAWPIVVMAYWLF
jgi:hypothetical protein